jgi:hypothetical protein
MQVFAVSGWRLETQEGSYVVTRSRPYPARQSREVEAVSGWRLGTATSCHLQPEMIYLPILDTLVCHLCTGRRPVCTFALTLSGPRVLRPSCPRCMPHAPMSPCPRAPSRLRRAHLCTGAPLRFAPLHCLSLALTLPPLPTCQLVNRPASVPLWPTGPLINRSTLRPFWSTEPLSLRASRLTLRPSCPPALVSSMYAPCPRVTLPTCPL